MSRASTPRGRGGVHIGGGATITVVGEGIEIYSSLSVVARSFDGVAEGFVRLQDLLELFFGVCVLVAVGLRRERRGTRAGIRT